MTWNRSSLGGAALAVLLTSCQFGGGAPAERTWKLADDTRLVVARDYDDTGPLALLVTYRCDPVDRPAFRNYLESNLAVRCEQWRSDGVIADYEVFFNWYVDEVTCDAMLFVRFEEYEDLARWKAIEAQAPGGLDPEGHALARPLVTSSADVVWNNPGERGKSGEESIFLLIPYEYHGLVSEYIDYVDGYVIPQMEGWVDAGVMPSYRILLNRFPTGDRWNSFLFLEYAGHGAFGLRKETKYAVRAELRKDAVWSDYSARKRAIRSEGEPVIADRIATSIQ